MSNYSGLDAITATPFDKHNNGSAEIISLWPLTAEIKSAKINSVNSMVKSQKFKPAEITRYTVLKKFLPVPFQRRMKNYLKITQRSTSEET